MRALTAFLIFSQSLLVQNIFGYGLPGVNLGLTNFLDGGPLRPNPGWYWFGYSQYYHSDKFLNDKGELLGGVPSPNFNSWALITQLAYQTENNILLKAKGGFDFAIPTIAYSHVEKNNLGITSSGGGYGNFNLGAYLQWDPTFYNNRPIFVHRLELQGSFPTGKNELPKKTINPGSGFYHLDPYWAATFYFKPNVTASWRMYYLWCARNPITKLKAGNTFHMNFSFEFEAIKNFHVGVNGYFLQQLHNNKLENIEIPNSKERVFGIGPGALYFLPHNFVVFGHLYFEMNVRNRTEGINFVLRLLKDF